MRPQVLARCNILLRTQIFSRLVHSEAISDGASLLLGVLTDSDVDVLGTLMTFDTNLFTRA